jgi:peptidoglycan/LPS O-acetylase OafA/YrhL
MTDQDRLHALDAVRSFALLLGVVIHASMSFLPGFNAWPLLDPSTSTTLAVVFFSSHVFRMVLFFTIAGFFAHLLLEKRGMRGFLINRLKRIGIPLVAFVLPLASLVIGAIVFGFMRLHPGQPLPPSPPQPAGSFPLIHLWFLYYLLLFYGAAALLRGLGGLVRLAGPVMWLADRITAIIVKSGVLVVALGLPAAWVLYQQPGWALWAGIPTPDSTVIPQVPALIAFGTAFAVGWLLHRQVALLASIQKLGSVYLAGAIVLTGVCLLRNGLSPATAVATLPGLSKLGFALAYTAAGWLWTFGIIGLAVRYLHQESPARRYLADASYWIYLTHLPLVFALEGVVGPLAWPWFVKFPLIVGGTLAVLILMYHYLVRPRALGVLLNGRRYPIGRAAAPAMTVPAVQSSAA